MILSGPAFGREQNSGFGSGTWLILQGIPSLSWTGLPGETRFAFEWEATPLLFSFGMNKHNPKWHFFFVNQPERFAGSIEFNVSSQLYPYKVGSSHWGFSGQILAHLPLADRGEYLGLNLGCARYNISGFSSNYLIAGFSSIFGFLHYNIKYSPGNKIWMHSIEFRFF
jgi:hypothetical protein